MRPIIMLSLCLPLAACAPTSPTPGWGTDADSDSPYPFAPSSMRIFPLTRLDLDAAGKPMIVCHIEFRDAWGDSAKAVGRLQVSMDGAITPAGGPRQDLAPLTWDVDLSDLDQNARLYDRATRTYRVQLVDLPSVLASAAAPRAGSTLPDWRLNLRATLTPTADGPPTLQDEYTLQP